jgi:imidazolonepropionase-like amidohydrolase
MTNRTAFILLLAAVAAPAAQAQRTDPADLIITNVTVIDPETRRVSPGVEIVIDDGRIVSIGKGAKRVTPAKAVIDGRGKFAIPGLMDMHAHTNLRPLHRSTLTLMYANGITGARDMASDCHSEKGIAMCIGEMRKAAAAIDAGTLTGPRLLALSTMKIQSAGGPNDPADPRARFFPQTPEQTAALIPVLLERKPDLIKMGDVIDSASYKLLIDAAKANRIEVSGHIPAQLSVKQAAELGQRSIEHARDLPLDCSRYGASYRTAMAQPGDARPSSADRVKNAVETQDAKICAEQIAALVQHGTYYVPTHLTRQMDYRASDPTFRNDPRLAWIVPRQRQMWDRDLDRYAAMPPEQIEAFGKFFRLGLKLTGQAHRAGVKIMAGTDANDTMVFPGFSLHDELALLVEAGLSPMDALRAATTVPAEYLRRSRDLGGLANGKLADIILLDANPIQAIGNTRRIAYVVQGGRVSDRAALDTMLAETRVPDPAR